MENMLDFMAQYLSKSDIYSAKAIAKISMFIFKYRRNAHMSQKDFAKMMGVTQAMVSKWESAEYNFTIKTISDIAEKLHTTFDIELTPESEYLNNSTKNQYEEIPINTSCKNNTKIKQLGFAA